MNKKQIAIYVIIAVVFFFIGGCVGARGQYNVMTEEQSKSLENNDDEASKDSNAKNTQAKVIGLNQEETFSNVGMKVLKAEESESVSNEAGNSKSSGKFIIVEVELKNCDKKAIQYSPDQFELVSGGSVYKIDDAGFDAMGNLNSQETIFNENKEFIGAYDSFNPGISKKTYLVFDVPKDVTLENSKLALTGNQEVEFALK